MLKLNQSKLVLPGQAEVIRVQLRQNIYRCGLTTAQGKPLEDKYAVVSTLQPLSAAASYSFSFCSPHGMLENPHSFRLFSHGAGKNYLVWTQNQFIFLTEVSKGNDLPETLMRRLLFHDAERLPRTKAAVKKLFSKKVKVTAQDFFWKVHVSNFVAQDFGLTSMPDIVNTPALITSDEYGVSRNSLYEELFVVSMSAPKPGSLSLQFVTPKRDVIYTASKKGRHWRLTGKETLTAKKTRELWSLLGN